MESKHKIGIAKVLLLVVIFFLALLVSAFFIVAYVTQESDKISPGKKSTLDNKATDTSKPSVGNTPKKYSSTQNWDDIKLTSNDAQRKQAVQQIQFKFVNYKIKYGEYPPNAQAASVIQAKNPLVDPETNKPYTIVNASPGLGEIQYKLSSTCESKSRSFEEASSQNIYAVLVRLSEGSYICKSNIY